MDISTAKLHLSAGFSGNDAASDRNDRLASFFYGIGTLARIFTSIATIPITGVAFAFYYLVGDEAGKMQMRAVMSCRSPFWMALRSDAPDKLDGSPASNGLNSEQRQDKGPSGVNTSGVIFSNSALLGEVPHREVEAETNPLATEKGEEQPQENAEQPEVTEAPKSDADKESEEVRLAEANAEAARKAEEARKAAEAEQKAKADAEETTRKAEAARKAADAEKTRQAAARALTDAKDKNATARTGLQTLVG
ncbi:MAG: hypothetical protein LBI34_04175, partial [Puniceicoccales bacterium]|nr:hypothetical protein [Puniceicoccales bacterium]